MKISSPTESQQGEGTQGHERQFLLGVFAGQGRVDVHLQERPFDRRKLLLEKFKHVHRTVSPLRPPTGLRSGQSGALLVWRQSGRQLPANAAGRLLGFVFGEVSDHDFE
jgi:hypothetical protein